MKWTISRRLSLAASVRHESARFDDDLNTRRLAPATTFDLRAEWRLTDQINMWIAMNNALDADIETSRTGSDVVGYDAPRRIGVGLRWIGP
jgi:outer membrane cobalamin receptor